MGVALATVLSSQGHAQQGSAVDTTRFVILFSDRVAGNLKVWNEGQENVSDYVYNDRGRGPHIRERLTLNPSSYITRATISGHNYLKDTVDERFSYDNGTEAWKNHVEGEGSKDPSMNISDIRKVTTVIRNGVVYRSADLYRELGIKP